MSKEIINVSTEILKIHPRNSEFFDDISGKEYDTFKQSIETDGVLSPILVSPDMTVISGHQRLKACKDLSIKLVPIMIREDLVEEDDKLKILLAANFGRTKNDESKQRKIAVEYVNLCGNKHGGNRARCDNRTLNFDEIATQLGTNKRSLQELLEIERKLTPEIKELIDTGTITKTTASKILTKLSPTEQEELFQSLPTTEKLTQKQVQNYIEQLKEKDNVIAGYEIKVSELNSSKSQLEQAKKDIKDLEQRIISISSEKNKTEIVTQTVDNPETLKQLESLRNELNRKNTEYTKLYDTMMEKQKLLNKAMGESTNYQLISHCSEITKKMLDFINEMGKYGYMAEAFNEIPIATKKEYLRCIQAVQNWSNNILEQINSSNNI